MGSTDGSLDIWRCLITNSIMKSIVNDTNSSIRSVNSNYTSPRDAKDTHAVSTVFDLIYLTDNYHVNQLNLKEL